MQKLIILHLLLILSLTSGCATYIKSRASDLADCFTVRGGLGPGLGVRAQVTNYLGASIGGCFNAKQVGYFGRQPIETDRTSWGGVPLLQFYGLTSAEIPGRGMGFLALLLCTDLRMDKRHSLPESLRVLGVDIADFINVSTERVSPPTPFLREKFFIEAGAALGYVSFDVGFNPAEFVDFLLGWTTLDITGDDTQEMPKQ